MEDRKYGIGDAVNEVRGIADNFEKYGTPWETQVRNQRINQICWVVVVAFAAGYFGRMHGFW